MATQRYSRAYNSPVGPTYTMTGSGVIGFGKLVKIDSAGYVELATGTGNPAPMGIAIANEVLADTNSAEQYADGDPVTVEAIVPGGIYNLFKTTGGNITINNFVVPSTSGNVASAASATLRSVYTIAQAIETGSGWVKFQAL